MPSELTIPHSLHPFLHASPLPRPRQTRTNQNLHSPPPLLLPRLLKELVHRLLFLHIRPDLGLSSSHVLITGASGGLGLELVRLFLDESSLVSAHYNSNKAGLDGSRGGRRLVLFLSLVVVAGSVNKNESDCDLLRG